MVCSALIGSNSGTKPMEAMQSKSKRVWQIWVYYPGPPGLK
jgi:hypothetical protein